MHDKSLKFIPATMPFKGEISMFVLVLWYWIPKQAFITVAYGAFKKYTWLNLNKKKGMDRKNMNFLANVYPTTAQA